LQRPVYNCNNLLSRMARVNDYTDPPPDFESATATKISGRQDDVIIA